MKNFFFILLTGLAIASCEPAERKPSNSKNKVFQVDAAFCEETQLPEVAFSVEYPKTMKSVAAEPGSGNYHYNSFYKTNAKGIQTEAIAFGYYEPQAGKGLIAEGLKRMLLAQVLETYSEQFAITDYEIKNFFFGGRRYLMLRAEGYVGKNSKSTEFEGNYILQSILINPKNDGENGLIVTFFANEESPCKSFGDFATKGDVGKVWKSFRYDN